MYKHTTMYGHIHCARESGKRRFVAVVTYRLSFEVLYISYPRIYIFLATMLISKKKKVVNYFEESNHCRKYYIKKINL